MREDLKRSVAFENLRGDTLRSIMLRRMGATVAAATAAQELYSLPTSDQLYNIADRVFWGIQEHYKQDEDAAESLINAYRIASIIHDLEPVRYDGSPYILHPVIVADIVFEILQTYSSAPGMKNGVVDPNIIIAALLHDVVENSDKITLDEIQHTFGDDVASMVDLLTRRKDELMEESLERLEVAGDPRVILIKLGDRIHNLLTCIFMPQLEKQIEVCGEAQRLLVPMARRLAEKYPGIDKIFDKALTDSTRLINTHQIYRSSFIEERWQKIQNAHTRLRSSIEENYGLVNHTTPNQYKDYLLRTFLAYKPLEDSLFSENTVNLVKQLPFDFKRKAHLILKDLQRLGVAEDEVDNRLQFMVAAPLTTLPQVLGVWMVLEGSAVGALAFREAVNQCLELDDTDQDAPNSFLNCSGTSAETTKRNDTYQLLVEACANKAEDSESFVKELDITIVDTFELLIDWYDPNK